MFVIYTVVWLLDGHPAITLSPVNVWGIWAVISAAVSFGAVSR